MSRSGAWVTIIENIENCLTKTVCGFHMRLPISDLYGFIYEIEGIISPVSGMEESWHINYIDEKKEQKKAIIGNGSPNKFEVVSRDYGFPASFPTEEVFQTAMSLFKTKEERGAETAKHGGSARRSSGNPFRLVPKKVNRNGGSRRRFSIRKHRKTRK